MDLRKIKTLIDLLEQSGISELEVKEGEESVRIARHATGGPAPMMYAPPPAALPAAPPPPRLRPPRLRPSRSAAATR